MHKDALESSFNIETANSLLKTRRSPWKSTLSSGERIQSDISELSLQFPVLLSNETPPGVNKFEELQNIFQENIAKTKIETNQQLIEIRIIQKRIAESNLETQSTLRKLQGDCNILKETLLRHEKKSQYSSVIMEYNEYVKQLKVSIQDLERIQETKPDLWEINELLMKTQSIQQNPYESLREVSAKASASQKCVARMLNRNFKMENKLFKCYNRIRRIQNRMSRLTLESILLENHRRDLRATIKHQRLKHSKVTQAMLQSSPLSCSSRPARHSEDKLLTPALFLVKELRSRLQMHFDFKHVDLCNKLYMHFSNIYSDKQALNSSQTILSRSLARISPSRESIKASTVGQRTPRVYFTSLI